MKEPSLLKLLLKALPFQASMAFKRQELIASQASKSFQHARQHPPTVFGRSAMLSGWDDVGYF